MSKDFLTAVAERRSHYSIGNNAVTKDEKIIELLEHASLHAPSAYNAQSTRVVLLLGKHHEKLWTILTDIMRAKLAPEKFPRTENKIKGFMAGYGTVLFFEDQEVVEDLIQKFPSYADNFKEWSLQGAGIMEYIVWTALESEGYGASLQHYNELIEKETAKEWGFPSSWRLNAQMPFGNITEKPSEKSFLPLEGRLKIFR
jgi:predicted oxidoreductase (fatty acid repression mutant protein)